MSDAATAECEVLEYVLGLDGLGLGVKGWGIVQRAQAREVRPLLLKQQRLLELSIETDVNHDAEVKALDAEMAAAWGRCLESLKVLWLTEGPAAEEAA